MYKKLASNFQGTRFNIINSVVWDNPYFTTWSGGTFDINYSDIEGGYDGTGNIDSDPLFVEPAYNDYNLQAGSPCIDAGTDFFVWEADTLVNIPPDEYVGSAPDMGAFEYGIIYGCTDPSACNYDESAIGDDGFYCLHH